MDAEIGDYHLRGDSPSIDAANSGSPYCNEPEPNGCRANQGAYGNTSGATGKAGVEHCVCGE